MWYLIFYCIFQTLVTVSWALRTPGLVGERRKGQIPTVTLPSDAEWYVPTRAHSPGAVAVLPRALLGADHVHQQGAERAGLGHCLP